MQSIVEKTKNFISILQTIVWMQIQYELNGKHLWETIFSPQIRYLKYRSDCETSDYFPDNAINKTLNLFSNISHNISILNSL